MVRRDRAENNNNLNKEHNGEVCILVKSILIFEEYKPLYNSPESLETVAVTVHLNNEEEILISSIYRVPGKVTTAEEWYKFFQSIDKIKYKIIGGDFNAHNLLWGSTNNCKTGENLLEIIDDKDLIILNDGSMTYSKVVNNNITFSAIDLTIVSSDLFLQSHWKILDDKMYSDHYLIEIEINKDIKICPTASSHKIKTKSINWTNFNLLVEAIVDTQYPIDQFHEFSNKPIDEKYNILMNILISAINELKPKPKKSHNKEKINEINNPSDDNSTMNNHPCYKVYSPLITDNRTQFIKNKLKASHIPQSIKPPWWNEEAEEINNTRKNLEKSLKQNPSLEQLKELKDYEIESKFKLKEIKLNSFKKYTETKLSREANINEVWETIHKFNEKKKK
ncbi:uncharacterized protein LOC103316495 [Nasonia vitripennis]|uniref:Endonuclease/exonuclease/phosphatase domain-containing protein n=1 Tax=Nasonia vitripennis TaxID=7425 RepID=A0A7M7H7T5_NASVI|nr:uncharacterized protein LOC103316495 [Nasonia vitripennis]